MLPGISGSWQRRRPGAGYSASRPSRNGIFSSYTLNLESLHNSDIYSTSCSSSANDAEQPAPSILGEEMLNTLFPTLAVALLNFKVDVVLARLEADFSDQPPSIPAVPNHQVSLQCPTAKYPRSAQPQSIPAVPNRRVSSQCPTTKYPCSAKRQSIPAVPNCKVSLQCPTAEYPCSVQPPNIPAGPNRKKYPCSAQVQSTFGVPNSKVSMFLQRICSAARKTVEGGQGNVTLFVQ